MMVTAARDNEQRVARAPSGLDESFSSGVVALPANTAGASERFYLSPVAPVPPPPPPRFLLLHLLLILLLFLLLLLLYHLYERFLGMILLLLSTGITSLPQTLRLTLTEDLQDTGRSSTEEDSTVGLFSRVKLHLSNTHHITE